MLFTYSHVEYNVFRLKYRILTWKAGPRDDPATEAVSWFQSYVSILFLLRRTSSVVV